MTLDIYLDTLSDEKLDEVYATLQSGFATCQESVTFYLNWKTDSERHVRELSSASRAPDLQRRRKSLRLMINDHEEILRHLQKLMARDIRVMKQILDIQKERQSTTGQKAG